MPRPPDFCSQRERPGHRELTSNAIGTSSIFRLCRRSCPSLRIDPRTCTLSVGSAFAVTLVGPPLIQAPKRVILSVGPARAVALVGSPLIQTPKPAVALVGSPLIQPQNVSS